MSCHLFNTITVGSWEFQLPTDWKSSKSEVGIPYMESEDGTKGCYIKVLSFNPALKDGKETATYLQLEYETCFLKGKETNWKALERTITETGNVVRSVLDLYDIENSYRILSVVLATAREAFQLTLHDYGCSNYEISKEFFEYISQSISRPYL